MFSKVSSIPNAWNAGASIEIPEDEETSVIGDAAVIVGDLTSEGEIEVQGTVEGNIRSRRVKVGEGGEVHGEIVAEAVDIPQILYNVPGRTACDMRPETVARLSRHR